MREEQRRDEEARERAAAEEEERLRKEAERQERRDRMKQMVREREAQSKEGGSPSPAADRDPILGHTKSIRHQIMSFESVEEAPKEGKGEPSPEDEAERKRLIEEKRRRWEQEALARSEVRVSYSIHRI